MDFQRSLLNVVIVIIVRPAIILIIVVRNRDAETTRNVHYAPNGPSLGCSPSATYSRPVSYTI